MSEGENRSGILTAILQTKAEEVQSHCAVKPLHQLKPEVEAARPVRSFIQALEKRIAANQPAVIAEIKKASPSRGVICEHFDPISIAVEYAHYGASCLSVLTDRKYFQGSLDYIQAVRDVCTLPILCKDFIIDPYQVYEARLAGADCILLIVAVLSDPQLRELTDLAHQLGMDILVEVHDQHELDRALKLPVRLIGINNRNLKTFETSVSTTLSLKAHVPSDRLLVTESGIHTPDQVRMLRAEGVCAFLVGEAFMKTKHPGQALQDLFFCDQHP